MKSKPSDWYNLSYEQQRAWERTNRELEDMEYERDQAREESEKTFRENQRRRQEYRNEIEAIREERITAEEELEEANSEIRLLSMFLKERNLKADYDNWTKGKIQKGESSGS